MQGTSPWVTSEPWTILSIDRWEIRSIPPPAWKGKYLGTRLLLSADLANGLKGYAMRPVGRFLFSGKRNSTQVVELLPHGWNDDDCRQNVCETFSRGLAAFGRQDWEMAVQAFQMVLSLAPGDGPTGFYLEQCDRCRLMNLGATWDGTVPLDFK